MALSQLSRLHVEKFLADLAADGVSNNVRFKVGKTLRTILKHAVNGDRIVKSPAAGVPLPKVRRPRTAVLTAEQANALLAVSRKDRLAAIIDLWLDTGARPGELYALHWDAVDLVAGAVSIHQSLEDIRGQRRLKEPKTERSRRRVRLAPRTVAALTAHKLLMQGEGLDVEKGLVFPAPGGGFLRKAWVLAWLRRVAKAARVSVNLTPYTMRHTSATLLLAAGVNIRTISDRLGHEGIEITLKHYAHVLPSMEQAAIEAVQGIFDGLRPDSDQKQEAAAA